MSTLCEINDAHPFIPGPGQSCETNENSREIRILLNNAIADTATSNWQMDHIWWRCVSSIAILVDLRFTIPYGMSSFDSVIAEECGVFWPCSFRWTVLLLGRRNNEELRVDWCRWYRVYPYVGGEVKAFTSFLYQVNMVMTISTSFSGWVSTLQEKQWSASDR